MELKIASARDEWIDKFKKKWDDHVNTLTKDKTHTLHQLSVDHTREIEQLKKERDRQIKKITLEFSEKVSDLTTEMAAKKIDIEKKHSEKLYVFLNSNLKQNTIYDSICSYILYFKKTLFVEEPLVPSKYEEPEIITYQDITDLQYVEPYPSGVSSHEGSIGPPLSPNKYIYKEPGSAPLSDNQQEKQKKILASAPLSYSLAFTEANYDGLP